MDSIKTNSVTWHNIYRPAKDDIQYLRAKHRFHELLLDELSRPTVRPKVQRFDHCLYLVLHFPIFDEQKRKTYSREIDFVMTKKELFTVSYYPISPLEQFFKRCAVDRACQELYASKDPIHLLYYLIKSLYEFSLRELDHIQEKITEIEEEIFSGKEREVVEEISIVGRDIIDFRRSIKPQEVTLGSLAIEGALLFGKKAEPFLQALIGEYQRLWNLLENHKETLDALYETNTTLLNIKQNDIMKTLTMMAFVTFPLMILSTLLVSNTIANPLARHAYDFWIVLAILAAAAGGILAVFKKQKWI